MTTVGRTIVGGGLAFSLLFGLGGLPGTTSSVEAAAKHYKNCAALNKVYPHGVGRKGAKDHVSGHTRKVTTFKVSTAVYNANTARDRDKDGIACEKL